jgi:glutaredoxin/glutathione-dependent peroxiredoxin
MTIEPGAQIPDVELMERTADGPAKMSSKDFFDGKRVVIFGVPGAFTPTCSLNHLPGYLENRDAIMAKGVDDIAVISVNDHHVMGAWAKASGGEGKIRFLADWDAAFAKATGLDKDLSAGGLGVRSTRFSMLVENGVVKFVNVEENPGQATVSSAATMLEKL